MNTIVVVANSAHVRFFNLQDTENPAYESGPRLIEQECLVNPQQEAPGRELWSDSKSGRNRSSGGGGAHGYDDHREQHRAEYGKRFLQQAAAMLKKLAAQNKVTRVVLAAETRVLGLLRQALEGKNDFDLLEVGKDYTKFTAQELQAQLASQGMLAPCRRPGV
jgi:protein required for attachment to host cells